MSLRRWFQPATGRLQDRALRVRKAHKIVTALRREIGDLSALTCLDVGCSAGLITAALAPHFRLTVGVELDRDALTSGDAEEHSAAVFVCGNGERLPVRDGSVDVVVCAQVYEHVADAARLFGEIERVLAPGGVCFLSGPNKWFPIEMHTGLPLIHWLPQPWAVSVARRLGRGEYDARPLTPGALRGRLAAFGVCDYTAAMIRDPEAFACADELGGLAWVGALPGWALRLLLPLAPNVNWVLRKKGVDYGRT
jgi:SAM-dependent methyltransferase